jgi:ABC-type branched-subunit amino acid transport system ATPase component
VIGSWLEVEGLSKSFGGLKALTRLSCSVAPSEIVGVIGPNGSGKTTFFNIITGFLSPDGGRAAFRGRDLLTQPAWMTANSGLARTFQIVRLVRRLSVLENVLLAFRQSPGENLLNVFFRPGACAARERTNRATAISLLEYVGLADRQRDAAEALSYGQQKLLSLTCCLASGADLFLLDEPVSGVAPEMIERISAVLRDLPNKGKSVLLIEHNVDVVMNLCSRVIFMDAGTKVCEGTPVEVRNNPKVIEACLG